MLTIVHVQFRFDTPLTSDGVRELALEHASMIKQRKGVLRKYWILSDDGLTYGGFYVWDSREAAEAWYDDAWRKRLTERYGTAPTLTWFTCPYVLDNTVTPDLPSGPLC